MTSADIVAHSMGRLKRYSRSVRHAQRRASWTVCLHRKVRGPAKLWCFWIPATSLEDGRRRGNSGRGRVARLASSAFRFGLLHVKFYTRSAGQSSGSHRLSASIHKVKSLGWQNEVAKLISHRIISFWYRLPIFIQSDESGGTFPGPPSEALFSTSTDLLQEEPPIHVLPKLQYMLQCSDLMLPVTLCFGC